MFRCVLITQTGHCIMITVLCSAPTYWLNPDCTPVLTQILRTMVRVPLISKTLEYEWSSYILYILVVQPQRSPICLLNMLFPVIRWTKRSFVGVIYSTWRSVAAYDKAIKTFIFPYHTLDNVIHLYISHGCVLGSRWVSVSKLNTCLWLLMNPSCSPVSILGSPVFLNCKTKHTGNKEPTVPSHISVTCGSTMM